MKALAYYRVSTDKQGRSGLGLEAQVAKVRAYLGEGFPPVVAFTEVESGQNADRPELRKAVDEARRRKLPLVVAKVDRLARDVRLFLELLEQGVDLRIAELPDLPKGAAGRFMLQQFAAVAELERGLISERTKAALAAAKARGARLGGYRGGPKPDAKAAADARIRKADGYADDMAEVVKGAVDAQGGLRAAARWLEAQGYPTPRGGRSWTPTTVSRTIERSRGGVPSQ
ncbi:recombinase family protein [Thalassobaculum litoreum]|uniref:Site-specific DNA recombinase n=1 Tax=Thalassobaculum litoreum DSM 18839 TaxID=1123362 RepID=A0A8G2BKF6_9PROT|nr:recombinase family protein [Thalassobaculum litoreum]SDG21924.1 Site-specific DNA recombinase [Thalassobaculum litoreum DSM 18839]